jgi:hypothetical protein
LRIAELKSVTKAEKFANWFTSNNDETIFIIFHSTWEKCFITLGSQQFRIKLKHRKKQTSNTVPKPTIYGLTFGLSVHLPIYNKSRHVNHLKTIAEGFLVRANTLSIL